MDTSIAGHTLSIAADLVEGDVAEDVERYLDGERVEFSSYRVDLSGLTPFQQRVVDSIRTIPYGETVPYGDLAARIGNKNMTRAVANACGANPVPIVIPCHRVIAKQGLGGYSDGGTAVKKALLRLEGTRM